MTDTSPPPTGSGAHVAAAHCRNVSAPFDLAYVRDARVDDEALERTLRTRLARSELPHGAQVDRLLRAVRAIDLTTLAGDDTAEKVRALCGRARNPLPARLANKLTPTAGPARTASVCIYHHFLPVALESLAGSGIPVAVVAAGFPAGLSPLRQRIDEVAASVAAGAGEIDAVINRSHALAGEWEALYAEVRAFREACGDALLKVILATGELGTGTTVARTARVCMQAGADFIKTSTGKEEVNATYPAGLIMLREIGEYRARTGQVVGFKPAGGIRTPVQALEWMRLAEEEGGPEGFAPARFRIGASSLLGEIVAQLERALLHPAHHPLHQSPAEQ